MQIKSVSIRGFRRFERLSISEMPAAKLIVLAGPNGSGKSSLFDAFSVWHQANSGLGLSWDAHYHSRSNSSDWQNHVSVEFHQDGERRTSFYMRSAYRNDPEFQINSLKKQGDPAASIRIKRMIEQDGGVSQNYQRLAADAMESAFATENDHLTLGEFRELTIGEIGSAVERLFPGLRMNTLGNPLQDGTFRFEKGAIKSFSYLNLSGGEKAAFDLILDMIVKRTSFSDTVFCIDEPEAHMNTRLQGALLQELYDLVPPGCQLWVATHSIGMMRKARDLWEANPHDVVFLDFDGHDFDEAVEMKPVAPTRSFWERVLRVALDDLAELVAPKKVIICEGNPRSALGSKNVEHDARCFDLIFGDHEDAKFVSAGNAKDVAGDRLRFAAVLPKVVTGVEIRRLIDRDDHGPADVTEFEAQGVRVLKRRHIESYLYDDEVLRSLYDFHGRTADFPDLLVQKAAAVTRSVDRGNPVDDVKSAAPEIYSFIKKHLNLTGCGNDQAAFARNALAPMIAPGMKVFDELRAEIFG